MQQEYPVDFRLYFRGIVFTEQWALKLYNVLALSDKVKSLDFQLVRCDEGIMVHGSGVAPVSNHKSAEYAKRALINSYPHKLRVTRAESSLTDMSDLVDPPDEEEI